MSLKSSPPELRPVAAPQRPEHQPTTTRREFTAALALTALGACVPRAPGAHPSAPAPAPTAPATTPTAGAARAPDPVAEALLAVVTARYGVDIVSAAERAPLRDAVARTVELSRRLRQPPVANGVDPFASLCPTPPTAPPPASSTAPAPGAGRRAP